MPIQTRLHLFSAAALALTACGPRTDSLGPMTGRTHGPRADAPVPTAAPSSTAPTRWARWPDLPSYRLALPRSPSQHFAADHDAETLASPSASAYPDLGPASSLPEGAVLVQKLYPTGATTPEVLFVMEKGPAGAWSFKVLDPAGIITDQGALDSCARCHAEAPHDSLFGRPR